MKRRLTAVLLCLLAFCCLLTACNSSATEPTVPQPTDTSDTTDTSSSRVTNTITTNPQEGPDMPVVMPNDEKLLVGGVNISSYKIVYGASPLESKAGSNTGKTIGEDIGDLLQGEEAACDFDYQTAVRLQQMIYDAYGYTLEIAKDTATTETSPYEILVGYTNRLGSIRAEQDLKDNPCGYMCKLNSYSSSWKDQLVICGGSFGATWHALDALESNFNAWAASEEQKDLKNGEILNGTYDMKLVACLGDSVLRGSQAICDGSSASSTSLSKQFGSSATTVYIEQYLSYPETVGRALWKDYVVYNYGQGWASMRDYFPGVKDTGPYYYNDTKKFANCLTASKKDNISFDLIVLQLGGNDGTEMKNNWTDTEKADYLAQAKLLIDQVHEGSPDAKVVLMNVPHRCKAPTSSVSKYATAMRAIQLETAKTLKTEGYDIYLYDTATMMKENLTDDFSKEGTSDTVEAEIHGPYYNLNPDAGKADYTHPNYLGYGKMAEHIAPLLEYILDDAAAPKYMIDIG